MNLQTFAGSNDAELTGAEDWFAQFADPQGIAAGETNPQQTGYDGSGIWNGGDPNGPRPSNGGAAPVPQAQTKDPAQIDAWLQWQANQPGADPILKTPEGRQYYAQKIIETDGLGSANVGYWQNKSTLASAGGAVGAGGGGGNGISSGSFLTPWTQQFQAPSAEDALNSPGLQFALGRAQQGLERSAAAKGTLLTGGTLRDLGDQQIGMALQGYGDVYNRAMGEYGLGRENFWQNQDRPYGKLMGLAGLGENAAAQTGNYGSQFANGATEAIYGAGNARSQGSITQGNIAGQTVNSLGNLGNNPRYPNPYVMY